MSLKSTRTGGARRSVCALVRWQVVATMLVASALVAACVGSRDASTSVAENTTLTATRARDKWVRGIDSFTVALDQLDSAITNVDGSAKSTSSAIAAFQNARRAFKRIEFLASYYEPSTAARLNGPVLPDVEENEGPEVVYPPEGLQVVEEWLFTGADTSGTDEALQHLRNATSLSRNLRRAAALQTVTDNRVWEAARLEIARVSTLGIVGFDSPIAQISLSESAAALDGVRDVLSEYASAIDASKSGAKWASLDSLFGSAIETLTTAESFADFNRLQFIVRQAGPLARSVFAATNALKLSPPQDRRAFRADVASIFDEGAFDAHAFANPHSVADSRAQVELGERLFSEQRIAGDSKQACTTCHDPTRAFTDGRARSTSRVAGDASRMRNTPTIINAGLQNGLFADQRASYLEDQVEAVLTSPREMHTNGDAAAARLATDTSYVRQFSSAFEVRGDSVVSAARMRKAIAAYVRSLMALNSRVDLAMRGDTAALSESERRGFNLFAGKAKCASCHFLPLFNGSVPPTYRSSDVEVLGVPARVAIKNARIDADSGRFAVTRSAPHLFAFKTPGIRNSALTAPYMHNGVYHTLEEVVDFYNRGGGTGIGIALNNQTLPFDSLQLSKAEQRDVVEFVKALTDTASFRKRDARRP